MDHNLKLGQKIKRYRLINDIRQEDMADQMGVSRATLINYEKGHTNINVEVLERLRRSYPDFDTDNIVEKPKIIQNNVIDFKVLFDVLFQSKRYIFISTFVFMIIGIGISYLFPKFYSASISLYPAKKDYMQGLGQFESLAMNLGMNSVSKDQDFNIPDVVKSNLIANKALNQKWYTNSNSSVSLFDLWEMNEPSWFNFFKISKVDTAFVREKAIKKFKDYVDVNEDRLSGLITIKTTFEDPIISSSVANFIGNEVQLYIQKENSAQSTKEKQFISERLSIVRNELEASELELKDFKERNRGYEDSPELFMVFSQLFREAEGKKEVYLTLQQKLELSRIDEVKKAPILHILDHAVPPSKKSFPNRILFLIAFALLGAFYSSISTVFRY